MIISAVMISGGIIAAALIIHAFIVRKNVSGGAPSISKKSRGNKIKSSKVK